MTLFLPVLLAAAVLTSLVAGFLFAFAVVVMPGIRNLDAPGFIRAFQVVDRVIQNGQPLFVVVWLGSVFSIVAAGVVGLAATDGADQLIVIVAAALYLLGVQLPTALVNIPLNNALQRLDVGTMNDAELTAARTDFENRWNLWNNIRTMCAFVSALLLTILLLRM